MQRTLFGTMMFNPRYVFCIMYTALNFDLLANFPPQSSLQIFTARRDLFLLRRDNLVGKSLDIYGEYGRDEIELLKQVFVVSGFSYYEFVCCMASMDETGFR